MTYNCHHYMPLCHHYMIGGVPTSGTTNKKNEWEAAVQLLSTGAALQFLTK